MIKCKSILYACVIAFLCNSASAFELKPNPTGSITKQGDIVAAIFGRGIIKIDSRTDAFSFLETSTTPAQVFPYGNNGLGVVIENSIYAWLSGRNTLSLVYRGSFPIAHVLEDENKLYIFQSGGPFNALVYDLSQSTYSYRGNVGTLPSAGSMIYRDRIFSFPDHMPVWTYKTHSLAEESPWKKDFPIYTRGGIINRTTGEMIIGGKWYALLIDLKQDTMRALVTRKHAPYDSAGRFDIDKDVYWLMSSLLTEGATYIGGQVFQSYPGNKVVYPPAIRTSNFKIANDKLFLETDRGIMSINTKSGKMLLYSREFRVDTLQTLYGDLMQDVVFVSSVTSAGKTLYAGQHGRFSDSSILLEIDQNLKSKIFSLPICGLKKIDILGDKLFACGICDRSDEGVFELGGGFISLDLQDGSSQWIDEKPTYNFEIHQGSVLYDSAEPYEPGAGEEYCYGALGYTRKSYNLSTKEITEVAKTSSTCTNESGYYHPTEDVWVGEPNFSLAMPEWFLSKEIKVTTLPNSAKIVFEEPEIIHLSTSDFKATLDQVPFTRKGSDSP